jgi:amino acid adenylation domain-containing protein
VLPLARQGATGSREFVGRAPRLEIDGELAGELEQLSHRAGGSVFTTLLTAFFVLLQRYTGASDLLVGSAVANRRWQTTEAVLGMFVNTVVFRGRLGGDPTFVELLARVRQMSLEAYDHQDLPFETVVKQLAIEHVQGVNPLIQTMFNFHDTQLRALSAAPLEITAIEGLANGSAKFELSVIGVPRYAAAAQIARLAGGVIRIPRSDQPVWPGPRVRLQGITLAWEFNAARFDDEFIAGMLGAYHQLLRSVVATPDAAISSLELLDEPTRRDLIARGRGPARDWQSHGWIPAAVDRWAERTPDAPALASHDRVVSYGELTRRADRLARRLRGLGIARDAVIGVCVPSSLDAAVAQLGVLKSGAAYLPLDPDHPQPWLAELLGDSGARAVVTSSATAGRIPASPAWTLVLLDELDDREAGGAALPVGQPSDLAYLIYTSGSTGRPKGVQVEHRSIAARFAQPGALDLGPGDTMLALASTAFDASVMELWAPLIHGASVHFPDRGWGIGELVRCLADHRISHVFLTTPLFHQVIDEAPAAFDRVRRLLFGGDVASPEIVRTLGDRGVEGAFNVYGPTETTVIATAQAIRAWRGPGDSVPIGSPLPNAHVVVLDDTRQLAPPGAVGEIWIGGPGVARGYLGAPALTAERFVEDPFDPAPGSRLYRTGDLGRWRAGALEFHGRRDHQVKIRGFRIELDEVRAAIARLPNVGSALVVVDRTGADARLLGYVVAEPGAELSGSAVRAALAGQLPGHMIPSSITVVERWPLTANGKIDAARLANARAEAAGDASGAPETADETVIAGMVAQVLGIARVGVHDSLYELGMDSLQAMKLASSIAAATRCDLGLASVLAHPTVAGLARELEARRTAGGAVTSIRRLPR